jgi:hypothetical protein
MTNKRSLIEFYQLLPHPEGGYYKEMYRSTEMIKANALPERFGGDRSLSTAIYFLLEKGNFSAFHRIKSDECWHFYLGNPLSVYVIYPDGDLEVIKLGNDPANGQVFQAVVPAGCWFASESSGEFSFVGCTVSPGFDFQDFELAKADQLSKKYPQHADTIQRLCR